MSRAAWISLVFALIMGAGAVVVYREFRQAEDRPAVQRQLSELRLRQFADAIAAYRTRHGAWPGTLFQLMRDAGMPFGANTVRGGGVYAYRPPPPGAPDDVVVMASNRHHEAVPVGAPWGAEGQVASHEIPAVAYVLTAAGRIEAISPAERDRRWKPADDTPSRPVP